jgi:tRNA A-37 threonylcarbamoyl transferase component Bud32
VSPASPSLQITAATPDPALLDLPWDTPLEDWPTKTIAALPRGISRHTVRFARLSGRVVAIKEIGEYVAFREYELLRNLRRLDVPSVAPLGVVSGRRTPDGEPLEAALVTEHLQFALPYRMLFSQALRPDTATRLIDALAVLLVRLHLVGFYWGDVSLSNTLFRRDAETFAAYLVDAETGDLHEKLTDGQRAYDLEVARVNIIGELMDLQAGDYLDEDTDAVAVGDALATRYDELWRALTEVESFGFGERWRVQARIDRLNDLGFDVDELDITTDVDGTTVRIQPKVVDAGHHSRRLMRLTGLDVQENQARRLLNDLDEYRAATDRQREDEAFVAHDWLTEVFEPAVRAVPRNLRGKLEPAQIYHELLDHRWFLSQQQHRDVPMDEVVSSYVHHILPLRPDEEAILGVAPGESPEDTATHPRPPSPLP